MRLQRGDVSHIDRQTRVTLKGSASKLAASRREAAISGAPIPEQPVEKKQALSPWSSAKGHSRSGINPATHEQPIEMPGTRAKFVGGHGIPWQRPMVQSQSQVLLKALSE